MLFSIVSLAALLVWGFSPGGTTSASAAMTQDCRVRLSVNNPILQGTPANPTGARVSWSVDNVPPCYRIQGFRVTFNFTLADGSTKQKIESVPGNSTQANTAISVAAPLARRDRPTVITATVVATAVPIDPQITATANATAETR
ncbi:MAG: hypothetical protein ACKVX9_03300 [Blastocatellia bacterium]